MTYSHPSACPSITYYAPTDAVHIFIRSGDGWKAGWKFLPSSISWNGSQIVSRDKTQKHQNIHDTDKEKSWRLWGVVKSGK